MVLKSQAIIVLCEMNQFTKQRQLLFMIRPLIFFVSIQTWLAKLSPACLSKPDKPKNLFFQYKQVYISLNAVNKKIFNYEFYHNKFVFIIFFYSFSNSEINIVKGNSWQDIRRCAYRFIMLKKKKIKQQK